jgi:catechol 2,3-dioxygenase-like lactoylglutathione lyase family enzyme
MSRSVRHTLTLGALTFAGAACVSHPHPQEHPMAQNESTNSPLRGAQVMAFAMVSDKSAVRPFYEDTLGLEVLADDPMALALSSGGTVIRLQKSANHQPPRGTVLGWRVDDIRAAVSRLREAGIGVERYEWMTFQDASGIATFPNGDMVAWFKDPDGNILSVAQLR